MITEPMTMATDYLLGVAACIFAWKTFRSRRLSRARSFWCAGFFLIALAAFAGGTFHGFTEMLAPSLLGALWKVTCYSVGVGSGAMLIAVADDMLSPRWFALISAAAAVQFVIYAVRIAVDDDFAIVVVQYGITMIAILVIAALEFLKTRSEASRLIISGVVVSFIAAAIQGLGISLHRHFNHNDLYHLVQIAGLWLLYRGAVARQ